MTCRACHGIDQGRNCLACLNTTRAVFLLPPLDAEPQDEPIATPEQAERLAFWCQAFLIAVTLACLGGVALAYLRT